MTMTTRSGLTFGRVTPGPETPPGKTQPLNQSESTRGSTGASQVAGPLSGLLRTPAEITHEIASNLDRRSTIALAGANSSLRSQLSEHRLAAVIISRDVPGVKTGEDAEAVLKSIGTLPVSRQGKLLEALGTHIWLQMPYSLEKPEAQRLFLEAVRSYTGKPSALLDAFRKAAEDPGRTEYLFQEALNEVENNGRSAQSVIERYDIEGNMNRAWLLAAESYVSSDDTPPLGNGATRFQAFR